MKKIWKYTLPKLAGTTEIKMPIDSEFESMLVQNDLPTLYYRVDPDTPQGVRYLHVVMTGEDAPEGSFEFRGVFQIGWFVGHVYEEMCCRSLEGWR